MTENSVNLRRLRLPTVLAISIAGTLAVVASAMAANMLEPFTQNELDNAWEADRQFPSDGVTSVEAFGRDNVARIGIDSTQAHPTDPFRRTEGIKTVGAEDFGTDLQVDLYLDPDWDTTAMRAGFWVVGDDGAGARDELFGIIEFAHNADHYGWRVWDSTIGWVPLLTDFEFGNWVTLTIELDTDAQAYRYSIDGEQVAMAAGGEHFIREVFLNSYNYGVEPVEGLGNDDYAAHWHAGLNDPENAADCRQGGWEANGFANQGRCIQFVNTGMDSR